MKWSCTNCLEPVDGYGNICDKCRALVESGWYSEAVWSEPQEYETGQIDEVYIKQLTERRIRSFNTARRRARHGL